MYTASTTQDTLSDQCTEYNRALREAFAEFACKAHNGSVASRRKAALLVAVKLEAAKRPLSSDSLTYRVRCKVDGAVQALGCFVASNDKQARDDWAEEASHYIDEAAVALGCAW